jgi:DNA-binding winged helix-turn-helix (wHTH) protein/tetratricopeptide (TPR) repeat protein
MPIRFGQFELDPRRYELTCEGRVIKLERIPMKLLFFLAESNGALVTRQAITEHLWGGDVFVDAQHSVNTAINKLRTALRDDLADPRFIQTVKGMGYRFIAKVEVIGETPAAAAPVAPTPSALSIGSHPEAAEAPPSQPAGAVSRSDSAAGIPLPSTSEADSLATSTGLPSAEKAPDVRGPEDRLPVAVAAEPPKARSGPATKFALIGIAAVLGALLATAGIYYRWHRKTPLTDKDTIVLAEFLNATGNTVFDDTLKTALSVSLRQSPFLNVLPDSQFAETLKLMEHPPDAKLTPETIRELCQRVGSKAYVSGSIVSLGSQYVLGLKAVNCANGDLLAEDQATAASKESVLEALDVAASKLRGQLGESLATVEKFDVPLEQATTSSLEALKALSLGTIAAEQQGVAAALPWHRRAIELDPNFAMAYKVVGDDYYGLGEVGRAREYLTRAFELRQNTSEWEKLELAAAYYRNVTGELDKAAQVLEEEIESYPRQWLVYGGLASVFVQQGQYEKAAEITRQAIRIVPDKGGYGNLANCELALQHVDEARKIISEAQALKGGDDYPLHESLYALAFLGGDSAGIAEQQKWFASRSQFANFGLSFASDTEAYAGHLGKARELTRQAVDSALRADDKENGAIWEAIEAQREAAFGNSALARQMAAEALKLSGASQGVESEAALAFAMAGDAGKAQSLARNLGERFPLDTQMQSIWLPTIQAQAALAGNNTASALATLQSNSPIEFGQILYVLNISCLYPTYVRGEAYLAAGQGAAAAAEFQKILDHSGIVWNCWTGAMAHLGVARANALQSRTAHGSDAEAAHARAQAAYREFFNLWKDADSDIPVLRAARAEYAELR